MDVVNERIQFSWIVWINWIYFVAFLFDPWQDHVEAKCDLIYLFSFYYFLLLSLSQYHSLRCKCNVMWENVVRCWKAETETDSDSLNSMIIVGMLRWLSSIVCVGQTCANTCPDTRVTVNIVFTLSHIHILNKTNRSRHRRNLCWL